MHSTREVLALLIQANPGATVCEERLRRLLRTGAIPAPSTVAGRFLWDDSQVESAARALGLRAPSRGNEGAHAGRDE